jgi:hypothetical protein
MTIARDITVQNKKKSKNVQIFVKADTGMFSFTVPENLIEHLYKSLKKKLNKG